MIETLEEKCRRLEHFETPEWAAKAILKKEELTEYVLDPCAGSGILAKAAWDRSYHVHTVDIEDYGFKPLHTQADFLSFDLPYQGSWSVFMNPPFSKAIEFVEKSLELGAEKIVCFQRFAWWESKKRRAFWERNPPARVYICGDRADCWRHDIPIDKRGSSSPTAHAWFVWDGEAKETILSHIWKSDV